MEGTYTIWLGQDPVGKVEVQRQGLYYYFYCKCQLYSKVICRVTITCGGKHETLGVLVPVGTEYRLTKKLPIKLFSEAMPEFWITPRLPRNRDICVDIYPEEPFRHIAKLENAYLCKKQDKLMIAIRDAKSADLTS